MAQPMPDTQRPVDPAETARVVVKGVSHSFLTADGEARPALQGIDLAVGPHEFVSLLGPSGCGKTTLLKIIGGLVANTEGRVEIDGGPVPQALRERKFGFVFQEDRKSVV